MGTARKVNLAAGGQTSARRWRLNRIARTPARFRARRQWWLPIDVDVVSAVAPLGPGSGIETVLHATAMLRRKQPGPVVVIADLWPDTIAGHETERYRECLRALASDLGLADRVVFVGTPLGPADAASLRAATDVECIAIPSDVDGQSVGVTNVVDSGVDSIVVDCHDERLAEAIHRMLPGAVRPGVARVRELHVFP